MNWYHLLSTYKFGWSFLVFETLIVIFFELIIRLILKETSGKLHKAFAKTQECKGRVIQLILLVLLSIGWFYLHHYFPCILVLCLIFLTFRIFVLLCLHSRGTKNISKKLIFTTNGRNSQRVSTFSIPHRLGSDVSTRQRHSADTFHKSQRVTPPLNSVVYTSTPTHFYPTNKSHVMSTPHGSLAKNSNTFLVRRPLNTMHYSPQKRVSPYLHTPIQSSVSPSQSPLTYPKPSSLTGVTPSFSNLQFPSSFGTTSSKPTPPGIYNTGNICFINSIIQCLATMEGFHTLLLRYSDTGKEQYNTLISNLISVLYQCQNWQVRLINADKLLASISSLVPYLVSPRGLGQTQSQQDAAEFLLWILDILHTAYKTTPIADDGDDVIETGVTEQGSKAATDIKIRQLEVAKDSCMKELEGVDSSNIRTYRDLLMRVSNLDKELLNYRDMSPVYELCCGQLMEARECQQCKKMSVNLEYYTLLPLPVPDSRTLSPTLSNLNDCLCLFSEVEDLTRDSNMLHCSCTEDSSRLTPGKRLALFSQLPSRLMIQLTRFSYDSVHNIASKNQSPIIFPVSGLDISSFTMDKKLSLTESHSQKPLYNLTGFCVHTGAHSTNYGHYIAYSKTKDGSWYHFNDDYVCSISDISSEISTPFVLQNAYILFYTLK